MNQTEFKIALSKIATKASSSNIEKYSIPIIKAMEKYDITTKLRQQHFLAQILHESGELQYSEEIASGVAYEGRKDLGNTQRGDGKKYKGVGLIQITGRYNISEYDKFKNMKGKLIQNPKLIATDPFLSADAAGWFWETRNINQLADKNDIIAVTKRINGGTNGLQHRRQLFKRAQLFLTTAVLVDNPISSDSKENSTSDNSPNFFLK